MPSPTCYGCVLLFLEVSASIMALPLQAADPFAMGRVGELPPVKGPPRSPLYDSSGGGIPRTASREKRTFKDKLHDMIQEAESAELQAFRESQLQDKKTLSISALVEGRPMAFVDFFYLTHRDNIDAAPEQEQADTGEGGSGRDESIPQDSLGLLKAQLVRADMAQSAGDMPEVYNSFRNLAKYFTEIRRLRKAEFFYKRCLQIAQEIGWLEGEVEANLALGAVYEEVEDNASAVTCYERRLELTANNQMNGEVDFAYHSLVSVYLKQAEAQESAGNVENAIQYYHQCLEAALKASDFLAAAKVNYRLGMLHQQRNNWEQAMAYHRKFLDLSKQTNDKANEGVAYCAFAKCQQELGDLNGAVSSLETYLELARVQDPQGQAVACCNLGIIYFQQNKYEQSVTYFEKFFEIARTLNDRRMLDTARINLGISRGAVHMQEYFAVVSKDLTRLIVWKNGRVPFLEH